MTSSETWTAVVPGTAPTAEVTRSVISARIGQPATVSHTVTETEPSSVMSTDLTMPSSVIGRWISGSSTPARAAVTCSSVGGAAAGTGSTLRGAGQGQLEGGPAGPWGAAGSAADPRAVASGDLAAVPGRHLAHQGQPES